jgi:hypothetical protein
MPANLLTDRLFIAHGSLLEKTVVCFGNPEGAPLVIEKLVFEMGSNMILPSCSTSEKDACHVAAH